MNIKNFILAASLMVLTAAPSMAQSVNSVVVNHYNRFTFGYSATFWSDKTYSTTKNALAVKYIHGFGISQKVPLYIETGLRTNWIMEFKDKYYQMSMTVPANLAYRFTFNDVVSLQPYSGLGLTINTFATNDGRDVSGEFNRVQGSWQIGVGVNIRKFYAGMEYGLEFTDLAHKIGSSHFELNVGVNF